ncbi:ABC transporter permease [Actinocorallia populi]|uniref:ABC transporter permease n=1 Tax=Actinocorallia populi TaxID=2079200 RepID=UPI000D094FF1|nr:ABC transporter permease [Actinocorallia populi]
MTGYRAALAAELLKARRSKAPLLTLLAMTGAGAMAALFMFVLADPVRARRLGILHQKAQLSGLTADWSGLLGLLAQIIAVGGLFVFAFITVWIFGQEFATGTLRYLLALPVPRSAVVLAKFTVAALWSALLTGWLTGVVMIAGLALDLPGATPALLQDGLARTAAAAALMLAATTPAALVTCATRSHLAALSAVVAALVLAQIAAALGRGDLLPWSVPAVAAGLTPDTRLGPASFAITLLTAAGGVLATLAWWRSPRAGR